MRLVYYSFNIILYYCTQWNHRLDQICTSFHTSHSVYQHHDFQHPNKNFWSPYGQQHFVRNGRFDVTYFYSLWKESHRLTFVNMSQSVMWYSTPYIVTLIPMLRSFQCQKSPCAIFGILSRLTSLPCLIPEFWTNNNELLVFTDQYCFVEV